MSWSITLKVDGEMPAQQIEAAREAALAQNPEAERQFGAAKTAVYNIILSGAVGPTRAEYHVMMSGHANPGHEPREGWANDAVTVSVSRV